MSTALIFEIMSCALLAAAAVATAVASAYYSTAPTTRSSRDASQPLTNGGIETAQMSMCNAIAFPFVGSCVLVFLFLAWKFVLVQYAMVILMGTGLTAAVAFLLRTPLAGIIEPLGYSRRVTGAVQWGQSLGVEEP